MRKTLLLLFLLISVFVANGQVLLSEGFDGTTFVPTGWTTTNGGTGTTAASWTRVTSGINPTQAPHNSSAGEAMFNAYSASTGNWAELVTPSTSFAFATGTIYVDFWMYRDNGFSSSADKVDVYVNTSNSSTGGTLLGTINRSTTLTPTVSANGWYLYTFAIPSSFNGTTNYIIFRGTSAFGDNAFIDDVDITRLAPCAGTPTAGTATASPNPVCPSTAFTLSATGYTVASGVNYAWQSSPAGANTWTNIPGANTPTYAVTAGITAATDYRFLDTCTASTASAISNTVAVTLNSYQNCYCIPTYANGGSTDYITNFVFGTISNNTSAAGNPSPYYVSYTGSQPGTIPIPNFIPGSTYTASVSFGSDGSQYSMIWIDFNHDGVFSTTEAFTAGTNAGSNGTTNISITIPYTALSGVTRLRVRGADDVQPGTNQACGASNSTFGEAEDYLINILPCQPPSPLVTTNSPVCPFGTITITATDSLAGYTGRTFNLSGPFTGSPITGNTTGIFTITNAAAANAGSYSVTINNGPCVSNAKTVTVALNNTPTNITLSNVVLPTTCLSNNGSLQINNLTPSSTYTLLYNRNSVVVPSSTITSTAAGIYVLGGLSPAAYSNLRVVSVPTGCTSNVAAAITVPAPNPPVAPVLTYNSPLCPNTTLTLLVTNPGGPTHTYKWTGPVSYTSNIMNATRPNMTSAFNGNYTVIDSVTTTGCTSQSTIAVTVTSPDPPPTAFYVTYCQYDTAVPIVATGLPGAVINYYDSAVGGTKFTSPPTPSTLVATTLTYWVSQSLICESNRVPLYILIKPRPLAPATQNNTLTYCQYDNVGPLSASGSNVRWFTTPTGGTGSVTAPTPSTLVPGTYYFYASQTVGGCESGRLTIAVLVKPKPQPPLVVSPLNLCEGDPIAPLTAVGQNLLWYTIPNGGVGVPVAPLPNTGYEDSFKYYVTQTVLGCESDRALIAVTVNYKPNGIITASSQWVCQDEIDSFFYFGNARDDADFNWFAPLSASFISGQGTRGPVVVHFDTSGSSVIHLTINNKGCISNLLSAPITVRPLPKISFVNRQDVCEDDLVTISLNHTEDYISGYHWDFGSNDYTLEYGVVTTGGPFGIRYPHAGQYVVTVTATKDFCTSKPIGQTVWVHARPDATIIADLKPNQSLTNLCTSDTLHLLVKAPEEGATYSWSPVAYFQGHEDTLNSEVFAVVSMSSEVKVHVRNAYGCEADDSIAVTTQPCCGVVFPNAFAPDGNIEKNQIFRPITIGIHPINTFRIVNRWGQVVYETKVERAGWNGRYNGEPQDMGTYYYYINYKCDGKNVEEHGEFLLLR